MSRRLAPEDLVGVAEIAERLDVSTSIVHDWRRRHEAFPAPVRELRMGNLWAWRDVESWARETDRLEK